MATAAPFVKLLRQLSSAKDEYRSGALDISWDGAKATLFFVFGQPNHATYEAEREAPVEGQEALAALLHNLPRKFTVAAWRKAVVRNETLKMTVDELMEPFAQLAGANSAEEDQPAPEGASAPDGNEVGTGIDAEFAFSLEDFPLLPLGESMWSDAALNVVHLDLLIPKLPTALIVLTGPKLRAAALTLAGQLIDAVWVDEQERAAGEGAAMALMGAREGTVSCYRIDIPRLAEALTMLWRCPVRYKDISIAWLEADRFINSLTTEKRDCVVRIDGPVSAVGFFMNGDFVAGYSTADRIPSTDITAFRELLAGTDGTVTILQRAGDRAVGRAPGEDAFHAYVAPSDDDAPAEVPSYAAGAAAIEGGAAVMEPAAVEPEPTPAWASGPDTTTDATTDATSADSAPATAEQPAPGDPDAAAEDATVDDGADIAADFFGVPADELTPSANAGSSEWGLREAASPEHDADAAGADLPDSSAASLGASSPFDIPDTSAGEDASPWAASGAASTSGAESTEPAAVDAWGTSHSPAETSDNPFSLAPAEESIDPLFGDAPVATPAPTSESGFMFGSLAADEPAPVAAVADATYDPTRLDLDFDSIKQDLIQIGVLWLGSDDVAPVAELIRDTKPSVDDFVATIDAIKAISVVGHDPSVIRAMAREMHYHAAEYLSGA